METGTWALFVIEEGDRGGGEWDRRGTGLDTSGESKSLNNTSKLSMYFMPLGTRAKYDLDLIAVGTSSRSPSSTPCGTVTVYLSSSMRDISEMGSLKMSPAFEVETKVGARGLI